MTYADHQRGGGSDLEGRYANYFEIGHNAFEFLLDFGQLYCEDLEARMHTRIITNPLYAKALLGVLLQAVREYEGKFGEVAADLDEAAAPARPRAGPTRPILEIV
jgi:hypothetical protein